MDNYEEKYKKALSWMQGLYKGLHGKTKEEAEEAFPELVESEDEEIRKFLIQMAQNGHGEDRDWWNKCVDWLEKQGEQKPAEVEPKFKVEKDKWYVCTSQHCNCIEGRNYKATSDERIIDDYGTEYDMHSDAYQWFRPWTIQDAKDGDVLYSPCCKLLWIYKDDNSCYVGNNLSYNKNCVVVNSSICIPSDVCPATKEQRDLLFQKMKEAGYEWDAGKKELKKIEQKSAEWSEEDEKHLSWLIEHLNQSGELYSNLIDWLKSLRPQNWTKEDKERYISCLQRLGTGNPEQPETINSKWFKEHVYPQSRWKPSEEQMNGLKEAIEFLGCTKTRREQLQSLYEQLKKLREE